MKYIDVSEWQGQINWEKVKPEIDGAILRAGYGKDKADVQFARNAAECNRLGIPCGAYWFSYAKSAEEAEAEARCLVHAVSPYRMELPLCYDFEYASVMNAERQGVKITKELASSFVRAFCDEVERLGYWALNYANPDYLSRYFDEGNPKRYGLWLASWPETLDLAKPPRSDCVIWQWTSKGSVPGIAGNVDMDMSYQDFRSIITRTGLNHLLKEYDDGEGGIITEHTQAQAPVDPTSYAMEWAKSKGHIPLYAEAEMPLTWGDFALMMFREKGPEDDRPLGGLVAD